MGSPDEAYQAVLRTLNGTHARVVLDYVAVRSAARCRLQILLAPAAVVVWLLARLTSVAQRRRNFLDTTNSRAMLLSGYYMFVEAVRD